MIDFCVPGFSKCGTTTLCNMLNSHPEIYIPDAKEPGYFAENFARGRKWYEQSFLSRSGERLAGDGSTTYSSQQFADVASDRILAEAPACKFIFIARNPKTRLESSFREMHASGYKYGVEPDFEFGRSLRQLPNMVADTLYWKLINVYRSKLPDSQLHVLFLEDLKQDPGRAIQGCFEFLGVPDSGCAASLARASQGHQLNAADTKLRDTTLLRWIRGNSVTSRWWRRLSVSQQEHWARRVGLRRRFDLEIVWDDYARQIFEQTVKPDALEFLAHYQKTAHFWGLGESSLVSAAAA